MVSLKKVLIGVLGVAVLTGVLLNEIFRETAVPTALTPDQIAALKGFEAEAPATLLKPDGQHHVGRWKQPIKDLTLAHEVPHRDGSSAVSLLQKARDFVTLKHWDYLSFVDGDFFVSVCVLDFHYLEDTLVYLVERSNPEKYFQFHARRFPVLGVNFARSSLNGCSSFSRDLFHQEVKDVAICYDEDRKTYDVQVNVPMSTAQGETRQLHASFAFDSPESLVISYPLAGTPTRPGYTHKSAGMDAVGRIKFGDAEPHHFRGHAARDWTKTMALHETVWNWVSVSGTAVVKTHTTSEDGKVTTETSQGEFGINLSARVYDVAGESSENGFWLNHTVYALGGVKFEVPKQPLKENWKITSLNPTAKESLELHFIPKGAREDHTNVGILVSEFVQPYGIFSGVVRLAVSPTVVQEVIIDNAFGVVEEHFARW